MNTETFDAAQAAYKQGQFAQAIDLFQRAKAPGEVSGEIDHLLGNCYMRLGQFDQAAQLYADALRDLSYGHTGALASNRGRALLAAGKPQDAVASLVKALQDEHYPTPYKAQLALGDAYLAMGNTRNAGVAYRAAAIDETNPKPTYALKRLGDCFMKLGCATDAIEAYRTGLDFASDVHDQNALYDALGLAYVAANRMSEAVDAFRRALADGTYQLPSDSYAAYEAAQKALASVNNGVSDTDALLAAAGYGSAAEIDPLDPLGKSGSFIPSPEDTGFFSITDDELVEQDKQDRKVKRKHKHTGTKVFIVLLILVLLVCGGGFFLYYRGYGWPTSESVVEQLFKEGSDGQDVSSLLAPSLTSDARTQLTSSLPTGVASTTIKGVDRSTGENTVLASEKLTAGGTLDYKVKLVRDGISWKVYSIKVVYPSQGDSTTLEGEGSAQ